MARPLAQVLVLVVKVLWLGEVGEAGEGEEGEMTAVSLQLLILRWPLGMVLWGEGLSLVWLQLAVAWMLHEAGVS